MADPIIASMVIDPSPARAGQPSKITVTAHDSDQRTYTVKIVVTDSAGHTAQMEQQVLATDPLTYSVEITPAPPGVVTVDPILPNVFNWTPPG